ncbi:MAG TPA: phage tail protein [Myxococcales bacterium]|jgi:phage tail-like protein
MAEAKKESAQGAAAQRSDPYRAYNFTLEIDGKIEGYFTRCSGLGVRVTPIRYREGGDGRTVHYLAGPVDYGEITLKYGLSDSKSLWDWLMSAASGLPARKNISLIMQGSDGVAERLRWNLFDSWPCEWRGAPLDAGGKEVAIETLILVCERVERA